MGRNGVIHRDVVHGISIPDLPSTSPAFAFRAWVPRPPGDAGAGFKLPACEPIPVLSDGASDVPPAGSPRRAGLDAAPMNCGPLNREGLGPFASQLVRLHRVQPPAIAQRKGRVRPRANLVSRRPRGRRGPSVGRSSRPRRGSRSSLRLPPQPPPRARASRGSTPSRSSTASSSGVSPVRGSRAWFPPKPRSWTRSSPTPTDSRTSSGSTW